MAGSSKMATSPRTEAPHETFTMLLLGTNDENSPLVKLAGATDVLQLVWSHVKQEWIHKIMRDTLSENNVAFAHVDDVRFPKPQGLNVNMMPFVMGNPESLPQELRGYWNMIGKCVQCLAAPEGEPTCDPKERVGYLTVHESVVPEGESQRRPGLHTEGFTRAPCDTGSIRQLPRWHPWGFGHAIHDGRFEGGLFMASSVSNSCNLYNAIIPEELVGRGGDVENLRLILDEHFHEPAKPRQRYPNERDTYYEHAGCARGHMHMVEPGSDQRVRGPISLQAGELVWFTDRTPHESAPLSAGQHRQFFRLVTGGIDTWYAAHSTPNPLGTKPEATIVEYDKFTGAPAALPPDAPKAQAPACSAHGPHTHGMRRRLVQALAAKLRQAAAAAGVSARDT